jgi:hypothetical protein
LEKISRKEIKMKVEVSELFLVKKGSPSWVTSKKIKRGVRRAEKGLKKMARFA